MKELHTHPFDPVFDENSRILILGSFPSVRSRETGFYYGHPQNRFWRVVAAVTGEAVPVSVEEKIGLLRRNGIALWDVARECTVEKSSDASLGMIAANDIRSLLSGTGIKAVFCNGKRAFGIYERQISRAAGIAAIPLPSTSAANAGISFEGLIGKWMIIKKYLPTE